MSMPARTATAATIPAISASPRRTRSPHRNTASSPNSISPWRVGQLRTDQRAGNDRQRHQRQRHRGAPQIADRAGREGEHQRGIDQEDPAAEHDHHPQPFD